jgi:hypothetical protein
VRKFGDTETKEGEVRSTALETFLIGVTVGIGITLLSLYTQKPRCFVTSIETIAEVGRMRRAREEEKELRSEKLKAMGFSEEEIEDSF